jgi:hypothetical protein
VYFDKNSIFGEPFEDPDSFWTNAKRMRQSEYDALQRDALGPFPNGYATLIGELSYSYTDLDGHEARQRNHITTPVSIFGPGAGAPAPPTFSYNVRLRVDGGGYDVTVPISQSIGPGETDRFLLHIAAEKSSLHEFDVLLRYNDTAEIVSRPIKLELFLSRLDADLVENQARDVSPEPA